MEVPGLELPNRRVARGAQRPPRPGDLSSGGDRAAGALACERLQGSQLRARDLVAEVGRGIVRQRDRAAPAPIDRRTAQREPGYAELRVLQRSLDAGCVDLQIPKAR